MELRNVILPYRQGPSALERWDIKLDEADGTILSMKPSPEPASSASSAPPPSLLLPALCHPHIHLDKAYILTCNNEYCHNRRGQAQNANDEEGPLLPDYSALLPRTGTFAEALASTAAAKALYTPADLHRRGAQLLAAGCRQGVGAARAFVEVDAVAGTAPLGAAARLRREFRGLVEVQVCAFAQEALFSPLDGDGSADDPDEPRANANLDVLSRVLSDDDGLGPEVDVLGTAPYVEASPRAVRRNIRWAVETALARGLHLDFHLDYSLADPVRASEGEGKEGEGEGEDERRGPPYVHEVLDRLEEYRWAERAPPGRTVVLGHCTQLTRLTSAELRALAARIRRARLPVHFVGLPTSDLYMMGRPPDSLSPSPSTGDKHRHTEEPHARPRGTLQIPSLIRDFGLSAALGANNAGNAFTPQGTADPLQLACWGAALYHAGTPADAALLYGCVSWRAREAIGLGRGVVDAEARAGEGVEVEVEAGGRKGGEGDSCAIREGARLGTALLVANEAAMVLPGSDMAIPARPRLSFKDVVWDPPELALRRVIRAGMGSAVEGN